MNTRNAFRVVDTGNEIANHNRAHPCASAGACTYDVLKNMRCIANRGVGRKYATNVEYGTSFRHGDL